MPHIINRHGRCVSVTKDRAKKMLATEPYVPPMGGPDGPPEKRGNRLATPEEIKALLVQEAKDNVRLFKQEHDMQMKQKGMMVIDPSSMLPQNAPEAVKPGKRRFARKAKDE